MNVMVNFENVTKESRHDHNSHISQIPNRPQNTNG